MLTPEDVAVEAMALTGEEKEEELIKEPILEDTVSLGVILAMASGMGGLQVVCSTIFSNGTIYLKALGLTHAWTSAIWSIPAICGFAMQPVVGAYSDSFPSRYGRRRPFVVVGAGGIILSILILASAGSLGSWTAALIHHDVKIAESMAKAYAIFAICTLSLSIQPLQCGLRALALDLCPARQQVQAQSWTARLSGIGQIVGCVAGIVYYPNGDSLDDVMTFRVLSTVCIVAVSGTVVLTCLGVKELPGSRSLGKTQTQQSLTATLRNLLRSARDIGGTLGRVFLIQSLSWMGWFGFLFYNASHISSLYSLSPEPHVQSQTSSHLGSFVTLLFSIVGFATTILLPLALEHSQSKGRFKSRRGFHQEVRCSSLLLLWSSGLGLSAALMLILSLASSWKLAMAVTTANGVSFAITSWLPFAIIGRITRERDAYDLSIPSHIGMRSGATQHSGGVVNGLHNAAISGPQILAAAICGIILETARRVGSVHGTGWLLAACGLSYLAAGYLAFRSSRHKMFDSGNLRADIG
ncbi:hypothetical protein M409DRAFT_52713 [Zasmidium cellare ATCC 36951]|uniref:Major facilitator superfamily (MFS) profile domain-containing protein n=1 Tax=Zasmidium cellare ATCC 36951 TaxID=1080233 RepID=A0A6A6CTG7_ZASCE|nr:uncharacterized protein M409DRAFT_52713 [Zasmidium cellare ATCC 36951]KAF2169478.1 hypothetical protein M409DRAFT_52713 [Zasmidium cellare ATCC 36951]